MWKVVITEIQDAGTLEPTRVPPGAFFVSTERFSRTVDDLDLQALIKTIDRASSLHSAGLREADGASLEPDQKSLRHPLFQTDP
jgi:hypothetical protein